MKILNYLLLVGVFCLIGFVLYLYLRDSDTDRRKRSALSFEMEKPPIEQLVDITAQILNGFLRKNFTNQNLTKQELDNKNAAKARLRQALKDAAYGDREAKTTIKEYIKSIITTNPSLPINENTICEFIPFDSPQNLTAQDKFLMIIQSYLNLYGDEAVSRLFADLELDHHNEINSDDMEHMFETLSNPEACRKLGITPHMLDWGYEEQLEFITQRVFESYKGFGVADVFLEANIDEIDAGVSGIPSGSFVLNNKFVHKIQYSYDSLWIMVHGRNIHLSCLSFGSQENLERVCHNIYKYHATKVFSREKGYVVSSMKNGSRVVVTRPPFSDKYAFYVRKFDSAPSIAPESLITGPGCEIPLTLFKWFVKGQRNIAITGQQGTGKTTMLKAAIAWIENLNIRTQELAFELNLAFSYPDKNISSFQETDSVSAQEGLNLQKKTNGSVNIVGEVSDAKQASHIIQTANVASLFAMFTHHAKTTRALVDMFALNLLQIGLYKEKRDAVEISARTLNVDIHLENEKGYRHIDRISEVIPIEDREYPSETIQKQYEKENGRPMPYNEDLALLDQREYYRRQTDRNLFHVNELCRWNRDHFELIHMPSDNMIQEIRSRIQNQAEEELFLQDMERIQAIDREMRKQFSLET